MKKNIWLLSLLLLVGKVYSVCNNSPIPGPCQYVGIDCAVHECPAPAISATGWIAPLPCNPFGWEIDAVLGTATANYDCHVGVPLGGVDSAVTSSGCTRSQTRTWWVTDACGHSALAGRIATWTVDTTAPTFVSCVNDITRCADSTGYATATWSNPAAHDDCTSDTDLIYSYTTNGLTIASGASFPIGMTTVTCTVKDKCEKVTPCTFTVSVVNLGAISTSCQIAGVGQTILFSLPNLLPPGRSIVWTFNGVTATGTGTSGSTIWRAVQLTDGDFVVNACDSVLTTCCATPTTVHVSGWCGTPVDPTVTYNLIGAVPAGYGCSCDITFGCLYPTKVNICPIACYQSTGNWQMEASRLELTYAQSICSGADVPCAKAALDLGVGELGDVTKAEYYNMSADIEAGNVPFNCDTASTASQVITDTFNPYAASIQDALLHNIITAFWAGITQYEPNADMTDSYNGCVSP